MKICENYKSKIEELVSIVNTINDEDFDFSREIRGDEVMPLVKKFLRVKKTYRELKQEFEDLEVEAIIEELTACGDEYTKMLKVISKYSKFVAAHEKSIKESTRIFIGPLFKDFFKKIPSRVKHIYTEFPKYKVEQVSAKVGGRSTSQLREDLQKKGITAGQGVEALMDELEFWKKKDLEDGQAKSAEFVILSLKSLGFVQQVGIHDINIKAQSVGLELVSPKNALEFIEQHPEPADYQPLAVGMEPKFIGNIGNILSYHALLKTKISTQLEFGTKYGKDDHFLFKRID